MPTFLFAENAYITMDKRFLSVRDSSPAIAVKKQRKCRNCGQAATKEALFDVGGDIIVIERYCEPCSRTASKSSKVSAK